jgi:hypothetical protein
MDTCNYCTRPAHTQINNQIYCGKLCAAMRLIAEVHAEREITRDNIGIWAEQIIENICWNNACYEDRRPEIAVPVMVRWSDAADVGELHASAPKGINYVVVPIDDKGTPDWEPAEPGPCKLALKQGNEATLQVSQAEIDQVVEDLLRDDPEAEDLP